MMPEVGATRMLALNLPNFAAVHESGAGPNPPTLQCSKLGSFLGCCGRTGDLVGTALVDPLQSFRRRAMVAYLTVRWVARRRPGYLDSKRWLDDHGWEILAYRPPKHVAA